MRLRLILMRHAKSSWNSGATDDHARPLNGRGRHDAPRIAARLVELDWQPKLILSSDAQRTRETCDLVTAELSKTTPTVFLPSMYHGGVAEVAQAILAVETAYNPIMAVGHNPGWEEAVGWWTGESIGMTTANAALLEIDRDDWPSAIHANEQWTLVEVLRPKELDEH